jgi:hypothetical protein
MSGIAQPLASHGEVVSNIYFMAVARFGDRSVVASYCKDSKTSLDAVHSLLNDPSLSLRPGARYNVQGDFCVFHFTADSQNRVYILVSSLRFPERVAFACLNELQQEFGRQWGDKSLLCAERALDKPCMKFLGNLCQKYNDPREVDVLRSVEGKLEVVKVTMQDNIKRVLENSVKLDDINKVRKRRASESSQ